jgi:hypothetical protein
LTNRADSKNTNVTFRSTKLCIAEEKISLNVSRFVVNPACIAGVLPSRRCHLGLNKDLPETREVQPPDKGIVVEIPKVGGLRHRYVRRAA